MCTCVCASQIVVLSDVDKAVAENIVRQHAIDLKGSRLVIREGSILSVPGLHNVSAQHARCVCVCYSALACSAYKLVQGGQGGLHPLCTWPP